MTRPSDKPLETRATAEQVLMEGARGPNLDHRAYLGHLRADYRVHAPWECGEGVVPKLVLQTHKVHRHPKLSVALLMLRHAHLVVGGGQRELVEL